MEEALQGLTSFPPDRPLTSAEFDKQAKTFVQNLTKLSPSIWTTVRPTGSLLDALDPSRNTIPYTFTLLAFLKATRLRMPDIGNLLPYVANYIYRFDPRQIKYVSKQWRELYTHTAEAYAALRPSELDVLATALIRIDPACNTLTSNHVAYVRLCLQSGRPSKAVPLLDRGIDSYEPQNEQKEKNKTDDQDGPALTQQDILEYHLLGGTAYISQQQWDRAQLQFELVILYPSPHGSTSALQVEAYKKWILVSLMLDTKPLAYAWATSGQVTKSVKALSRAYEALAESFQRRDWRKFQAELDVGGKMWQQDGNAGLANAASHALLQYCIEDLRRTFMTVPMSRVAEHLSVTVDEASQLVNSLISSRQLDAHIDSSAADPTVIFGAGDNTELSDDAILVQQQRIDQLIGSVKQASKRLLLSKEYIEATKKSKRQGQDSDPADQMDLDYTSQPMLPSMLSQQMDHEIDEDIMA